VIVPAYKLPNTISILIDDMKKYVSSDSILVIDDGSNDGTFENAHSTGVKVLKHFVNKGKAEVIKTGFAFFRKHKEYDFVITIDGDLQHPPDKIPDIINSIEEGYDFIIGDRMTDTENMPLLRYLSNKLSSWGISVVLGFSISDSQCGFRALKRWVVEDLDLVSKKYAIESEMALQAGIIGAKFSVVTIPTIYNDIPSHINPVSITINIVSTILKYYFITRFGKSKIRRII